MKECEVIGGKILSGIQDDEVRKHIESCRDCAVLFQDFAELKMHHARITGKGPKPSSELDMKILCAARSVPAARERKKTMRQYMYLAASIAVFAIGSYFLLQDSGIPVQKSGISRIETPAQNEANLLESVDALNCELFSLTAQLDTVTTELNENGYHS